jgi:diguanylate cyclase (GGDEF)-like protein
MLHQTAEAWLHQIRETDLLARMGGEEFALVLPDTPLEAGRAIGKRLLQAVPAGITASAGIARWYGEDADMLYRRADEALYAAKAAGRAQLAVATDDGED